MENTRILSRRRWSRLFKAQLIGAAVGALVTIGSIAFDAARAGQPRNRALDDWDFALGITTSAPTHRLIKALGLSPTWSPQGWDLCEVVVNTTLGLLLATPVGGLLALAARSHVSPRTKTEPKEAE